MDKTQGLKVTRRSILKTIPALSAISAGEAASSQKQHAHKSRLKTDTRSATTATKCRCVVFISIDRATP